VDFSRAGWRKSSRSGNGGNSNCVEVAVTGSAVGVRDSKSRRSQLSFESAAWRSFADAVKAR
jgi:hypothetical protein